MVYFIGNKEHNIVKIGYSKGCVESRLKSLKTGCPYKLEIFAIIEGELGVEKLLHRRFSSIRLEGEWFSLHPQIIQYIETYPEEKVMLRKSFSLVRFDKGYYIRILKNYKCKYILNEGVLQRFTNKGFDINKINEMSDDDFESFLIQKESEGLIFSITQWNFKKTRTVQYELNC
jgi:hypothetical protein